MSEIRENLEKIRQRIDQAAKRSGRDPDSVQLIAVSKKMPSECIEEAISCGQKAFGENYLQEAVDKIKHFATDISWHFIGRLQSNKVAAVADAFTMVETVDRLKIARTLDRCMKEQGRVLPILIQVNIGAEPQKSGVLPEDTAGLLEEIQGLNSILVKGLMVMPPYNPDPEATRPYFRQARELAENLQQRGLFAGQEAVEISMGMSGDFEVAIEEGATLVRVGTALFGQRRG